MTTARAATKLRVSAFEIPTSAREADGTLEWDKTVLVTVEVSADGRTGFGYTYADVSAAHFVREHLAAIATEADPRAPGAAFSAMDRAVRNVGREGVAATAIAAVDMSLWDLKARLSETSFVELVGRRRASVEGYGSGGFTSYSRDELARQLGSWREQGFARVKMKIGRDPKTLDRVRAAREAIGSGVQLFVDANGAYTPKQALHIAESMAIEGVTWFEEPVSADDLDGLRFVRDHAPPPMAIAAGEYGYRSLYFDRMLAAGAVDVLQADATRCGVTGFLQAAALCEARGVPLSAHCAPSLHAHLGCTAPNVVHVECFHDHVRIEGMLFEGAVTARGGALRPDATRAGFGLELKRADAERYVVFDQTVDGSS